jgi:hypothetical protein
MKAVLASMRNLRVSAMLGVGLFSKIKAISTSIRRNPWAFAAINKAPFNRTKVH